MKKRSKWKPTKMQTALKRVEGQLWKCLVCGSVATARWWVRAGHCPFTNGCKCKVYQRVFRRDI